MLGTHKKNEELKFLPLLLNFVFVILFISLLISISNFLIGKHTYYGSSPFVYLLIRLLYFGFVLYLYLQIRILSKNKFKDRALITKLINRFRLLGLLFLCGDIIPIMIWIIASFRDIHGIILFLSFYTWSNSMTGIILLSLAEMIFLVTRFKEENDLTV